MLRDLVAIGRLSGMLCACGAGQAESASTTATRQDPATTASESRAKAQNMKNPG
jgi:hypothetical protein